MRKGLYLPGMRNVNDCVRVYRAHEKHYETHTFFRDTFV